MSKILDWNRKRLELMGLHELVDGPLVFENLKELCSDRFRIPNRPCDEVYPKIFVGGERASKDPELLKSLGITHIVNASCLDVPTGEVFYLTKGFRFTLLNIAAQDTHTYNLALNFDEVNRFIEVALHTGGKILVHSKEGISRAPTLAIGFLMKKRGICGLEAVRTVRRKRHILPNDGFLNQLCELDKKIRRENNF